MVKSELLYWPVIPLVQICSQLFWLLMHELILNLICGFILMEHIQHMLYAILVAVWYQLPVLVECILSMTMQADCIFFFLNIHPWKKKFCYIPHFESYAHDYKEWQHFIRIVRSMLNIWPLALNDLNKILLYIKVSI